MILAILILAVGGVAFTNGANANFKGVSSLYGSGTTSLRGAALWGTLTTLAGSLTALFLSGGMLAAFGGKGLVEEALASQSEYLAAVALGGAATSFLATRFGFPVSTTHALIGALLGASLAGQGQVHLTALGKLFLLPLLLSPVLAAVAGALIYLLLRSVRLAPDHRTLSLDVAHYLSAGAASFARGLNDTPKIAAPLMGLALIDTHWIFLLVALTIAAGGIFDIRNVAETLGKKVTEMNPGQGLAACMVTAILVCTASLHAMPVSTTHVSVGSLTGMGAITGQAHWRTIGSVALAWICTLPCGAFLAAIAYLTITHTLGYTAVQ
ncbi:MAG: inorganic phosphate transporter [Gemmataceae bacterium]